jgi:catechol 2,3-dioxygenase-like lactoylglutathione lyase family enzyme
MTGFVHRGRRAPAGHRRGFVRGVGGAHERQAGAVGSTAMKSAKLRLFRVIVPVGDIERAARFYRALLADDGRRVSAGRHYFDCGGTILACYDPRADGDAFYARANQEHLYFAVENLENVLERARAAAADGGGRVDERIETRPWGERSFYMTDPFGNPLCFVDAGTVFTGE